MNILVFGANGQLGSSFRKIAKNYIYSWTFVDKDDIDFCDKQALSDYLYKTNFDIVVNCAAYTAVDAAENVIIVSNITKKKYFIFDIF